jgi:uncharacterized tellurite resistance protein B-like protein
LLGGADRRPDSIRDFKRTLWRIQYTILASIALSCADQTAPDPDIARMTIVLENMVRAHSEVSGDSLTARRNAILKEHGTDETEVRAWIARIGKKPEESQRVAQQLAAALENKGQHTIYKKDR